MRSVKSHRVSPGENAASKLRGAKSAKLDVSPKTSIDDPEPVNLREPSLNRLKPAKRSRDRIPPPQRERIRQKYITGKGISEISREEGRNRETVARIVRSDEVRANVLHMREGFYGLMESSLATVRHAVEREKNPHVAYKILNDSGVIPAPAERAKIFEEQKTPKDRQESVYRIMANLVSYGTLNCRHFGIDTSAEDAILARAGGRVDENGEIVPIETSTESTQPTSRSDHRKKK